MKSKVIVMLGQTSTGKSSLAVELAKQCTGEIISADSRQIYKGLDIGTGKITASEMSGVKHYLLDVVEPNDEFSVVDYKKRAERAITSITKRGNVPIVVGGTGFYIKALVDDVVPPAVKPDKELRAKLESKSPEELLKQLENLDQERAETIEKENPRRLIRAIEIATHLGNVPALETGFPTDYENSRYSILQIGLRMDDEDLKQRIVQRTKERIDNGWLGEVWQLLQGGLSWQRLREFGLGYRCITDYFEKKLPESEIQECIVQSEWQYARRQHKWFKRDTRIQWFTTENRDKIFPAVKAFLKK